jgi:hypothetical protein
MPNPELLTIQSTQVPSQGTPTTPQQQLPVAIETTNPIETVNAASGNCFNCGKPGHWAIDCKMKKYPPASSALGSRVKGTFEGHIQQQEKEPRVHFSKGIAKDRKTRNQRARPAKSRTRRVNATKEEDNTSSDELEDLSSASEEDTYSYTQGYRPGQEPLDDGEELAHYAEEVTPA